MLMPKMCIKPVLKAILTDRPDYVCVPFTFGEDYTPYVKYKFQVIIQKMSRHNNSEETSAEEFERDQVRLEKFCQKHNILCIDDVRRV